MFLIYGTESFLIKQNVNEIKEKFSENDIIKFEENVDVSELTETISFKSLFSPARLIIVENFNGLNEKINKKDEQKFQSLISALSNEDINQVVFVHRSDKITKNLFSDFLLSNAKQIKCEKIAQKDLTSQVYTYLNENKVKINREDVAYFLSKMPDDLNIIMQECDKLISFKGVISRNFIDKSVSDYILNDPFGISNAIETKNFKFIYSKYREKMKEGDVLPLVIAQISSIFILAHQVYNLKKLNLSAAQISKELNVHEYRVKKAFAFLNKYSIIEIKKILKDLDILDKHLKTFTDQNNEIFESFLIKNFARY